MNKDVTYVDQNDIFAIHQCVLNVSGGLDGVRDAALLLGCLDFIKSDVYYPKFEDKLTHLVYTIAKNHAFIDGNKRTSIGIGVLFLLLNRYSIETTELFMRKMECLVLDVVQNKFTKDEMKQIISDYIKLGELSKVSSKLYKEKGLDPNEVPE